MRDDNGAASFELAPMSRQVSILTAVLWALPVAFLVSALIWAPWLAVPAILVIAAYAWVWLRFRPKRFIVRQQGFEVVWPLKVRRIPTASISSARVIDRQELKQAIGWGVRIGAGGLWGGFGLLGTSKRGLVQMYVSRTDRFVWIEMTDGRPWLITPDRPEAFVRALPKRGMHS